MCPREFIPPHIIAEAISTLHGLDLRWSGPITPSERQYVEQYVLAMYPQYSHGLIEDASCDKDDLYSTYYSGNTTSPEAGGERRRSSPVGSPSAAAAARPDMVDMVRLEPSRLLDILTKKSSFTGSFISIPEIQARNRVLRHCGLTDDEYLVLFAPTPRDAMMLVGCRDILLTIIFSFFNYYIKQESQYYTIFISPFIQSNMKATQLFFFFERRKQPK